MSHHSQGNDDILILTENDLVKNTHLYCVAKTKKGGVCKNKSYNKGVYCKLHHKQFGLEKPDDCSVCMESLENVEYPLRCGHWIHKECLLKWKEDTCPMCRSPIKFTVKEKRIKNRIHKNKGKNLHNENDVILPPEILELIESILIRQGIPEYQREEFISGFLQIDVDNNSIILGSYDEYGEDYEEFSASDIEDFPDISEF